MSRPDPAPGATPAPVRIYLPGDRPEGRPEDRPGGHPEDRLGDPGAERAARLARLRAALPPAVPVPIPAAISGGFAEAPSDFRPRERAFAPVPKPAEVPPPVFAPPVCAAPVCAAPEDTGPEETGPAGSRGPEAGLGRLPGIGPGLIWALGRAGVADLAALATAEPEALAARLGPAGRLVPLRAWIAFAREG